MAIEPGRALKRQALPDREPQPPADAATWEKRRSDTHRLWADETYRIAALWLEEHQPRDRTAVLAALVRFTDQVNGDRARVATKALTPAQGREQLKIARARVDTEIREVLGDDADVLRDHLQEHLLGGGW